jgi:hypothetical protein
MAKANATISKGGRLPVPVVRSAREAQNGMATAPMAVAREEERGRDEARAMGLRVFYHLASP